jgi:hypothetical protein
VVATLILAALAGMPVTATPTPTPTRVVSPVPTPATSQGGIAAAVKRPGLRMPSANPGPENPKLIRIVSTKAQGQPGGAPVATPGPKAPLTEKQEKLIESLRAEMAAIEKEASDKRDTYELAVQSACSGTMVVEDGEDFIDGKPVKRYRVEQKANSDECRYATYRSDEFWGGLAGRREAVKTELGQAGLPSDVWYSVSREFGFL